MAAFFPASGCRGRKIRLALLALNLAANVLFPMREGERCTVSTGRKAGPLAKFFAVASDNGMAVQAALKFRVGIAAETELIYRSLLMIT